MLAGSEAQMGRLRIAASVTWLDKLNLDPRQPSPR
jgi:hypothetical protein